jgi:hypothetical protein
VTTDAVTVAVPLRARRTLAQRVAAWPRVRRHVLLAFAGTALLNLAVTAAIISHGLAWNDASSRLQSALAMLWGSDPHLAAVGFTWMPLPTLLDAVPMAFYPLFPWLASTGLGAPLVTSVVSAGTAALLVFTADRLGLPLRYGWLVALLVALNPMLLVFAASGMSEGTAGPLLIAGVAFVTLYWHTGQRRYVALSGAALALAIASVYQATVYAGVLLLGFALTAAVAPSEPVRRGRPHATIALSTLLALPSAFVIGSWLVANAVIQGRPFSFMNDPYSNAAQNGWFASHAHWGVFANVGDLGGSVAWVWDRTWPCSIPLVGLLLLRALDGRLRRPQTLVLVTTALCVPLALELPRVYHGASGGSFRYLMYPLFVAAGWSLYEIASSGARRRATAIVVAAWLASVPILVTTMLNPAIGSDEEPVVSMLLHTKPNPPPFILQGLVKEAHPTARFIEDQVFSVGGRVLADSYAAGPFRLATSRRYVKRWLMTEDRHFQRALRDPARFGVHWVLMPDPREVPEDALVRTHPLLWSGRDPRFQLVHAFAPSGHGRSAWRLFELRR